MSAPELPQDPAPQPAPRILEYRPPVRSLTISGWLRLLPRPSWATLCLLLCTAAAAYWLYADHAPWIVTRQFEGALAPNSPDAAISPDGTQLVLIRPDRQTLRLYDIPTGRVIRDFHRPSRDVTTAHFSPDATRLWSIGTDQNAVLWETSTGKQLASLPVDDRFPFVFGSTTASPFSADGKWLVGCDVHATRVYDAHTGALLTELAAEDHIQHAIFSPDGRYLAGVGDSSQEVLIIETNKWQRLSAFAVGGGWDGMGGCNLAFTPDSKSLAIACRPNVYLWDAATNRLSTAFAVAGQLSGCRLSPNGRYLLTLNSAGPEEIWDMTSRTRYGAVPYTFGFFSMISPDGTRIADHHAVAAFPSLDPLAEISSLDVRVAWLPGSRSLIAGSSFTFASTVRYPVQLLQRRRPEANYGVFWLPQFWLMIAAAIVSASLMHRDIQRWRLSPPLAQL